jgi:hypothetical protein
MPPVAARLKDLLDETRLAMLGTQILLGLQHRAAFSERFMRLPGVVQKTRLRCVAVDPADRRQPRTSTRSPWQAMRTSGSFGAHR